MKRNIFKGLLVCGAAAALAGCSENSWNEKYLDGFEAPDLNTPQRNYVDYTLTSSDYSRIAKMKANIEKATAAGVLSQLEAVGTNGYFTETISAKDYLGAWLDSVANTTGSPFKSAVTNTTARISYETASDMPEPVVGINGAMTYTVTTDDYIKVYSPEELDPEKADYADAFSPMCPADKNVPAILAEQFPNAAAGDYVYVTYNQSATNPVWGGGSTGGTETPKFELSNTIASAQLGGKLSCSAVVTGLSSYGIVISDNSGSIFIYLGKAAETDYFIGEQIVIEDATVAANYAGLQLSKPTMEIVDGTTAYTYPTAPVYDVAAWNTLFNDYVAERAAGGAIETRYIQINGTPYMSGTYLNVKVGDSEYVMSPYGAFQAVKDALTVDVAHNIKGYTVTYNQNSKYISMLVTEVDGKPIYSAKAAAAMMFAASRAAANVAYETVNAVYTYNGSKWSTPSDVYVLTATDYKQMGTTNLTAAQAKTFLPQLLA